MTEVMLEIKWATRFDSPACLDTYQHSHGLMDDVLKVEAMCRNDSVLLSYKLLLDLWGAAEIDKFELQSVGRARVTLRKLEPGRWLGLVKAGTRKPSNLGVWWDIVEIHESTLDQFERDKNKNVKAPKIVEPESPA